MAHYEKHNYHDAVELLRTAVQRSRRRPASRGPSASSLPRTRTAEAIQSAEAFQLAPTNAAYYVELAELLLGQGLKLRARHPAETAARLAPGDPRVQKLMAELGLGHDGEPPSEGGLRGLLRRKP